MLVFPADDVVLVERVREILVNETVLDAERAVAPIEERQRPIYATVVLGMTADLAGFGGRGVYVFRDGSVVSARGSDWPDDPSTARVVSDSAGLYVDANQAAAALFGVAREEIVGRRAGVFTAPTQESGTPELWTLFAETGRLHSLAELARADGTEQRVEFITRRDPAGAGRIVTALRPAG